MVPKQQVTSMDSLDLHKRVDELESRNRDLERVIMQAGEALGLEAVALANRAGAWLGAIVESSDDAIVSKDLNGIVTSWNPAAERIFGFTAEEMVGAPILKIIPEDLHGEERHIISRIRQGLRIDHFETVRRRKDGRLVNISVSVSPVLDGHGRVIGASKIARDVTSQREAERARGVLAAIIESSDDAIISKDLTGIITSWNRAAEQL
jgi:two-component system sensor histidine kinase VicK